MRTANGSGVTRQARALAIGAALTFVFATGTFGSLAPAAASEFDVSVASVAALSGLTATVAHSDNGVNLRANPSQNSDVLDKLPDGTDVALRVDEVDTVYDDSGIRWWPVRFGGKDGWIAGIYLAASSQSASTSAATSQPAAAFAANDYVAAQTDTGTGLIIRAGVGVTAERVGFIAEGDVVQVMEGPVSDGNGRPWYVVTDGAITGYSFGDFLVPASQPAAPAKQAAAQAQAPAKFASGDFAAARTPSGTGVNIRSHGSLTSKRVGFIPEGSVVQIVDGPKVDKNGNVWYLVDGGGIQGYSNADLLAASSGPISQPAPAPAQAPAPTGPTGRFIYPIANYVLTQGYGCTPYSFDYSYDANLGCPFHNGIDLAAPAYTPVMAADGGTVLAAGWCDCGLGYYVEIDHGNGFSTIYGHMAEQPYVAVGQQVNQGGVIGPVGSTGASTGPHTHFMIKLNGNTVNPLDFL